MKSNKLQPGTSTRSEGAATQGARLPAQPGAGMTRLLDAAQLKQVGGGYSGPSNRGAGH